ncbi:diguanylate cyclase domain-containing protein [Cystobacter fuscus]
MKVALQRLLDEEHARRGVPDATGALHPFALTQGALLREEFDLSTHAHRAGWTLGALIVDVKGMIHVNARHGFPAGDAMLRAVVASLQARFPGAKVVRLHGDNFAVLLVPTSGLSLAEAPRDAVRARLAADVAAALPRAPRCRTSPSPGWSSPSSSPPTGRCSGPSSGESWSAPTPSSAWDRPRSSSGAGCGSTASCPARPRPEETRRGRKPLGSHPRSRRGAPEGRRDE